MLKNNKRATMLAVGVHVAAFSCEFKGKTFASGKIVTADDCSRSQAIEWAATYLNGKWTIEPANGRTKFSSDPRLNTKMVSYVELKLKHGQNIEFDEMDTEEAEVLTEGSALVAA